MVRQAICLKCDSWKSAPYARCKHCNFKPAPGTDEELQSVYLSLGRFGERDDIRVSKEELNHLSNIIRAGGVLEFPGSEIARLKTERSEFRSVRYRHVWLTIMRLFLPGLFLLGVLWVLIYFLRR
jgi:hypothetical protein